MTTKKTTTTELRRCKGSARFGIEPHEAPVSEFPKQPSRKDGLGVMCTEHWRAYVKGLREARAATKAVALATTDGDVPLSESGAAKVTRVLRSTKTTKAPVNAKSVVEAEALIAEVDALPGPEAVKRNGDPDVQAALETVAAANGQGRDVDGTEEADAA